MLVTQSRVAYMAWQTVENGYWVPRGPAAQAALLPCSIPSPVVHEARARQLVLGTTVSIVAP